ncbi:MAG: TolC family protein [Lentisphaeraceae bacterium]|nr:TolC family protein [Lentisphaeraceae bacterium]
MIKKHFSKLLLAAVNVSLVSCQTYNKQELQPVTILQELEVLRSQQLKATFNFADAAELMNNNSLKLKALKAQYEGSKTVAALKTPWANPELEAGPAFGSNLGDTSASATQGFVSLGFSIPLGPRLIRNDELNKAKELLSYNDMVMTHRQLYLELRQAYVDFALSKKMMSAQSEIAKTLAISKKTTRDLIRLGTATKLGLSSVEIQIAKLELDQLQKKIDNKEVIKTLSSLLVVRASNIANKGNGDLPTDFPQLNVDTLKQQMLKNNLMLADKEMLFHLADAKLRLALAKQYPDLKVGLSHENEVGEKKSVLSVPFSIELPIFDRNKQEIAAEFSERQSALLNYKQELADKLSELETSFDSFLLTRQKMHIINTRLQPLAKTHLDNAQKTLRIGHINILRYLDLHAESQQIHIDKIEVQRELWAALIKLEALSGKTLINLNSSLTDNK